MPQRSRFSLTVLRKGGFFVLIRSKRKVWDCLMLEILLAIEYDKDIIENAGG